MGICVYFKVRIDACLVITILFPFYLIGFVREFTKKKERNEKL